MLIITPKPISILWLSFITVMLATILVLLCVNLYIIADIDTRQRTDHWILVCKNDIADSVVKARDTLWKAEEERRIVRPRLWIHK